MIIKLLKGDKVELKRKYNEWLNLSATDKIKRNFNIATNFLRSGPSISNFGNAVSALFGGFNPENPDLHYGEAPSVGIKNFGNLVRTARVAREFNKVFKGPVNLRVNSNNFIERFVTNPKGSGKLVHYDKGNHKSVYQENRGAYIKNNLLLPGQTRKEGLSNYSWWNIDNPYMGIHKSKGEKFSPSRYIIVEDNGLFLHPFDIKGAVGQSAGKGRGFITKTERVTDLPVELTNAEIYEKSPFGWWERIKVLSTPEITKNKQSRLISPDTYPLYRGPRFDINEIVNPDGTVNPRKAMLVLHTVAKQFGKGAYKMEHRLEDPTWHKEDPNTYEHTKRVALSAWKIPTPEGYTKLDLMIAALGHDFGKIVSGDGHAQIGADLVKQVFIGIKPHLLQAIREHMGQPTTQLGEVTKAADILNGRDFNYLLLTSPELYNKVFLKSTKSNNSRANVHIMDNFKWKELSYPEYINHLWNLLKNKGIKTDPFDRSNTNQETLTNFFNKGFNPVFKLYPQDNLKAHAQEILRRMKNFGLDVDNTMGELPLYGKKSIRDLVTLNSGRTSYIGYYNKPGFLGTYFHNNGTSIVDPGSPLDHIHPLLSIASIMHHERNMHGTLKFLTPEMWKLYENFISKMILNLQATRTADNKVKFSIKHNNGETTPIDGSSLKKEELRATIGEMVRNIYNTRAYNKAQLIRTAEGSPNIKKHDLETIRPYFEKTVDEMSDEQLNYMLSNINGYGEDYAEIGPIENPKFFDELRTLLKIAPASLPFLIPRKEEKK